MRCLACWLMTTLEEHNWHAHQCLSSPLVTLSFSVADTGSLVPLSLSKISPTNLRILKVTLVHGIGASKLGKVHTHLLRSIHRGVSALVLNTCPSLMQQPQIFCAGVIVPIDFAFTQPVSCNKLHFEAVCEAKILHIYLGYYLLVVE